MGRTGEVIWEEYVWESMIKIHCIKFQTKQNRKRNKAEKHRVEPQKLQMKFSIYIYYIVCSFSVNDGYSWLSIQDVVVNSIEELPLSD